MCADEETIGCYGVMYGLAKIHKTFGWKNVLTVLKQLFTEDSLMIHFYSFEQKIMLKSLKIISTNNIET